PDGPFGLRLFGPQRQRVADGAAAERGDLARRRHESIPRPWGAGKPGAIEELRVVEERTGARENRKAVERALVLAAAREGLEEVLLRLRRQHVGRRVEQAVLGVAGEGVEVQHV